MMQIPILDRARVTPSDRKISAARPNLADDCAESRKLDGATAGKTSCEMLRAMLTRCQPGDSRVDRHIASSGANHDANRVAESMLTIC